MTEVYNLLIICSDGSQNHTHDLWDSNIITTCPENNPNHTYQKTRINSRIQDRRTISNNLVYGTDGFFRQINYNFNIPPGPNVEYQNVGNVSFYKPVRISGFKILTENENNGDFVEIYMEFPTPIGQTTSEVSSGTIIDVNSVATTYLKPGTDIKLVSGGLNQNLGECINVDFINHTMTVENDVTSTFPVGSSIYMSVGVLKNIKIVTNTCKLIFGKDSDGNFKIEPSNTIKIMYKNINNTAKNLQFTVEQFY
jgi:hypothetical protein